MDEYFDVITQVETMLAKASDGFDPCKHLSST